MEGHTVEEMLYTIRAFENKAKDITLPQSKYLEKFVTCLGSKARDKWARMEDSRGTPFQDNEWTVAKKEWIEYYVRDGDAKEVILDAWVTTREFLKPMDVEVSDHHERVETLCHYVDMLPGTRGNLRDHERKAMLYNSFPKAWKQEFILLRQDPQSVDIMEILDFMEIKKKKEDRELALRKKQEELKKNNNKESSGKEGNHKKSKFYKNSGRGYQGSRGYQQQGQGGK